MRQGSLLAVALASLFVTAGCLGFLGGGTSSTPTPSVPASPATLPSPSPPGTPPPTPMGSPTPGVIAFTPAVSDVGSKHPEEFANAHDAALQNTSFTLQYSRVRVENGTIVFRTDGAVQYDGSGTVYHNYTKVNNESESSTREHVAVWSNRTTARRVLTTANETTVETISPVTTTPTFKERVGVYLQLFKTRMTGYSRLGGEPTVRISGSTLERGGPWLTTVKGVYGLVSIDNGQFSADITDSILRRYHVELHGRGSPSASAVTVVTVEVVFTNLGTTTIRRPRWVTAANESRADTPPANSGGD